MGGAVEFRNNNRSLNVPSDIIYLIFLHLPVKSLLKFKSVCKLWINILESDEFMSSYRRFQRGERGIRIVELDTIGSKHDLLIIDPEEVDSSKSTIKRIQLPIDFNLDLDLVCLEILRIKRIRGVEGLVSIDNLILNPSTKEVIKLPNPNDSVARPSLGRHDKYFYCLGFDSDSHTYKVLALPLIFTQYHVDTVQACLIPIVLTLGTLNATWRDVNTDELKLKLGKSILIFEYISVDNKIFFLIQHSRPKQKSLLIFGIEEEKFIGVLEGQELPLNNVSDNLLVEVNGKLGILECSGTLRILENYEWNGNGNETIWIKRNIVLPSHLNLCSPIGTIHNIHRNSEIMFKGTQIFQSSGHDYGHDYDIKIFYFFYNLKTNIVRIGNKTNYWYFGVFKYVETPFMLKYRFPFNSAAIN